MPSELEMKFTLSFSIVSSHRIFESDVACRNNPLANGADMLSPAVHVPASAWADFSD